MSKEQQVDEIKLKLESMIGHKYDYANNTHTVLSFRINEEKERVYIKTDRSEYDRPFDSAMEWINHLIPAKQNGVGVNPNRQIILPEVQVNSSVIKDLKEVLLDNIKKIQQDKNYISQAEAVKSNVDSIIDLAKTEIAYLDTFIRMNKPQ